MKTASAFNCCSLMHNPLIKRSANGRPLAPFGRFAAASGQFESGGPSVAHA